jgi:Dna[CI] antecedent, DciA
VTRWPYRRRSGVDRGPRPLGESLDDAVAGLAPPPTAPPPTGQTPGPSAGPVTAGALSAVFSRWEEIVGPSVARHVRPVRFSGGVLVVAVDQPAWATQVRALGPGVLARVGEVGGVVPDRLQITVKPAATGR